MRYRTFRFPLALCVAALCCATALSMDVAELLEKHRAAISPDVAALGQIERFQMTGLVDRYGLRGEVSLLSASPDRFGVEHRFGGWTEKGVLTGETGTVQELNGWVRNLQGGEMAQWKAVRFVLGMQYLKALASLDVRLQVTPDAVVARFIIENDLSMEIAFSSSTFLINSFTATDTDGRSMTCRFEEYREVRGVKLPVKIRRPGPNPIYLEFNDIQLGGGTDAFFSIKAEPKGFNPAEKKPLRLVLKSCFGSPLATAWINETPLTFLVDFGLPYSVIDKGIAAQLGFSPVGAFEEAVNYPSTTFGLVEIPVVQFRDAQTTAEYKARLFHTTDMIPLCANVQQAIHGIIGSDFFHQNTVFLDIPDNNLRIMHPKDFAIERKGNPIPMANQYGVYLVPAGIDGEKASLQVSTSANPAAILAGKSPLAQALEKKGGAKEDALGLGLIYGLPVTVRKAEAMQCGDAPPVACLTYVAHFPAGLLAESRDAWIGCGFWKRYSCGFDFPRSELYLAPNEREKDLTYHNTAGMYIVKSGGKIMVQYVIPGTPAEKAGIVPGDIVTEINGIPADQYVFDRIYNSLCRPKGESVAVKILRGDQEMPLTLVTESSF